MLMMCDQINTNISMQKASEQLRNEANQIVVVLKDVMRQVGMKSFGDEILIIKDGEVI